MTHTLFYIVLQRGCIYVFQIYCCFTLFHTKCAAVRSSTECRICCYSEADFLKYSYEDTEMRSGAAGTHQFCSYWTNSYLKNASHLNLGPGSTTWCMVSIEHCCDVKRLLMEERGRYKKDIGCMTSRHFGFTMRKIILSNRIKWHTKKNNFPLKARKHNV